MGAMIFAMTDRGETAGDLAEQSEHQEQLVAILRAAEGMCQFVPKCWRWCNFMAQ